VTRFRAWSPLEWLLLAVDAGLIAGLVTAWRLP
jgi:hypothetical protein